MSLEHRFLGLDGGEPTLASLVWALGVFCRDCFGGNQALGMVVVLGLWAGCCWSPPEVISQGTSFRILNIFWYPGRSNCLSCDPHSIRI